MSEQQWWVLGGVIPHGPFSTRDDAARCEWALRVEAGDRFFVSPVLPTKEKQ